MAAQHFLYRPSVGGPSHGLMLQPHTFGLMVAGLRPTPAGADARRQGVLLGDHVLAAVDAQGRRVSMREQGEGELRRCLEGPLQALEMTREVRFRDNLPLLRVQQRATEAQRLQALIESHEQVEQRIIVLKAFIQSSPNPGLQELQRAYQQIQECEGALDVLELAALNVSSEFVQPEPEERKEQQQHSLHEKPSNSSQAPAPAPAPAPVQEHPMAGDTSPPPTNHPVSRPNDGSAVPSSPNSPPPPDYDEPAIEQQLEKEEEEIGTAQTEMTANAEQPNEAGQSTNTEHEEQKCPQSGVQNAEPSTDLVLKVEGPPASLKSARRDLEAEAETSTAKRPRPTVVDLTLDDEDDTDDGRSYQTSHSPPPFEEEQEHSRESIIHDTADRVNAPVPPISINPELHSNTQRSMSHDDNDEDSEQTVLGNSGGGDWDVPDAEDTENAMERGSEGFAAADSQSQYTEATQGDNLPAGDTEYEPSQELDIGLLQSQSPRTTRASMGLSQESSSSNRGGGATANGIIRSRRLSEAIQDHEQDKERQYFEEFRCIHEDPCAGGRCGEAIAMLQHFNNNLDQATQAMRALENTPLALTTTQEDKFREGFFQHGEDFKELTNWVNRGKNHATTEQLIAFFYRVFKHKPAYQRIVRERKATSKT